MMHGGDIEKCAQNVRSNIFPHYLTDGTDYEKKKVIEHKFILIFSRNVL
jgi:hypothetical protein